MKKRLLITSIVMMLVCAVALSTATYAWFTSNRSVQATRITMRASTSDAASLTIGWTGQQEGTFLEIPEYDWGDLKPLAPNILQGTTNRALEDGVTTYENGAAKQLFYSETVKTENNGLTQFNGTPTTAIAPVLYKTGDNHKFYVKNNSAANKIDYVSVSGIYTKDDNANFVYMSVDTRTNPPVDDIIYYENEPGENQKLGSVIKTERTNGSWDPAKVYYEKVLRYELTNDTVPQEDTTYYTITSGSIANPAEAEFTAVAHNFFDYVTPFSSDPEAENYKGKFYEKRDLYGDDMLRIAIFTREFRKVDKTETPTPVPGVKYYTYSGRNILQNGDDQGLVGVASGASAGQIDAFVEGVEYFYVPDRFFVTKDSTVQSGKTYYTAQNRANVSEAAEGASAAGLYEMVPETSHLLLGVLGKDATAFNTVDTLKDFDINEVYYSAEFTPVEHPIGNPAATDPRDVVAAFETTKAEGALYYINASNQYVAVQVNDAYDSGLSYYYMTDLARVAEYTKVTPTGGAFGDLKTQYAGKLFIKVVNNNTTVYTAVEADDDFDNQAEYYVRGFVSGTDYYTANHTVVNGKIEFNKPVNTMNYYTDVAEEMNVAYNLRPHEQVEIVAVAWFDGTALDDTRSNQYAQFSLFFDTDRTSHTSYNQQ